MKRVMEMIMSLTEGERASPRYLQMVRTTIGERLPLYVQVSSGGAKTDV